MSAQLAEWTSVRREAIASARTKAVRIKAYQNAVAELDTFVSDTHSLDFAAMALADAANRAGVPAEVVDTPRLLMARSRVRAAARQAIVRNGGAELLLDK